MESELSDKVNLFAEINEAIYNRRCNILASKERIPWAGSKVGPCYAVTTGQVVGELEDLQNDIMQLLRGYEIEKSTSEP